MSNFVRVDNIESSTHEHGTDLHVITVISLMSSIYFLELYFLKP